MPDDWRTIDVLTRAATFARRPSLRPGDQIAYYASGKGIVFATGVVTSHPYEVHEDGTESNWPWRVNVQLERYVDFIHDGVALEDLSVANRNLRKSVRQQSHIRLSEDEFSVAETSLPKR